jgi:hypothetical protein
MWEGSTAVAETRFLCCGGEEGRGKQERLHLRVGRINRIARGVLMVELLG